MRDLSFFIILLLVVLIGILIVQVLRLRKRIDFLFRKGDENLEEILRGQFRKIKEQEERLERVWSEIEQLKRISQRSLQKVGMVRFNPFKEVGGDQSFTIAVLDAENNGFVITSHYGRELNRVYAKPISKGVSRYPLSEEEKEAIEIAIHSKEKSSFKEEK